MNQDSKVSVIIPLYNQAQFVRETIESVFLQTYKNFEIVIVNDASTDKSVDAVMPFVIGNPDQVFLYHNPVNKGLPATRNVAISHAKGDYILPLDSDDRIAATYLQKTVAVMDSRSDIGMVSTWMHVCPMPEMVAHQGHSDYFTGQPGSGYPIFAPTKQQILAGNSLPVCSLLRKSMLAELGNYPEIMNRGSEDWALWAMVVHSGKWGIRVVPEHLFVYRVHKDSMCRSAIMEPNFEVTKAKIRGLCGL
jgi:glycosyltransferase involved in cell wall biosynthesis